MAMISPPIHAHPNRPALRTTFNFTAKIPAAGRSIEALYADAIQIVLAWIKAGGKVPLTFPDNASTGHGFQIHVPGQSIDCVSIPDQGIWTVRMIHPDTPFKGHPAVAGRSWSTDVALHRVEDGIAVGVRVICSSLNYAVQDIALTRPRIVLDLASRLGLAECLPIKSEAWILKTDEDLDQLTRVLLDGDRVLPVVVVSASTIRRVGSTTGSYLIEPNTLAKQLEGYAHVVAMPHSLSFRLTDKLGKPWSVFLGSVRTYMPRLDLDEDLLYSHPLLLGDKLMAFQYQEQGGEPAVVAFLRDRVSTYSATRRIDWGGVSFLDDAKTIAAEVARKTAADDQDWKVLLESEVESWKSKTAESQKQTESYLEIATHVENERDYYKSENASLRAKIDSIQANLNARDDGAATQELDIPSNYEEMSDWVRKNLAGSLVLHNRATRALKDAKYADVRLVYNALLLLSREYRDMRKGIVTPEIFDAGLNRLGLKLEKSITRTRAGQEGDEYFVRYPTSGDPARFLESHLIKGTDREARNCLRIYYFWDDDTQQVVVGWLPSHLSTRVS